MSTSFRGGTTPDPGGADFAHPENQLRRVWGEANSAHSGPEQPTGLEEDTVSNVETNRMCICTSYSVQGVSGLPVRN